MLLLSIRIKAIATINRTIVARLKRHLRGYAAICANNFIHLALRSRFAAVTVAPSCVAAIAATDRFVLEAFLCVKFLFSLAENKVFPAILTLKSFVFKSH